MVGEVLGSPTLRNLLKAEASLGDPAIQTRTVCAIRLN